MNNHEKNLALKKASLDMLDLSGYDITDDEPVRKYKPKDMEAYYDHAMNDVKHNAIRRVLFENGMLEPRSSMSNIYESYDRPNHYVVVFFAPIPPPDKNSLGKIFITPAVSLCALYSHSKRKYCFKCTDKISKVKRCQQCPVENYCSSCIKNAKCTNCPDETWCGSCAVKVKNWSNFKLSMQHCSSCTPKEECKTCNDKVKCEDCTSDEFCSDCSKLKHLERCEDCPLQQFCRKCVGQKDLSYCDNCPPQPQIIERFIIITSLPLSVEAKVAATTNIPRIKASTGEWLEMGCVMQVFMDGEILYNPLINSLGSLYHILSVDEAISLFNSKDNSVSENQIPAMDSNEAICSYLGLYPGNVLRVERKQVIAGNLNSREITYRLVKAIPGATKMRKRGLVKKKGLVVSGVLEEDW